MSRVTLTPVAINRIGTGVGTTAIMARTAFTADQIQFKNTGKEFIVVERAVSSTSSITIHTNVTEDGLVLPDVVHAMAAGDSTVQTKLIGPFPTADYNQSDGYVHVDSDSTDDTIAVYSLTAVD